MDRQSKNLEALKQRISDLEKEISKRENDIVSLKNTLLEANEKFEQIILQIQKNIDVSFQIQKKLAPTELPLIPDFEFSMKFIPSSLPGGDYYDIFEQKDRLCFGIIMAESNEYHVSALLLSCLLQMSEAFRSKEGSRPEKVMRTFARKISEKIKNNECAHFFYGQIDRRSFEMRYVLMGNILPIFQKHKEEEPICLEPCSGPIEKKMNFQISKLKEKNITFDSKDRFILCTQGLLKSKNNKGQSFGFQRFRRSLLGAPKTGVHELRNKVLFDLSQFSSKSVLSKDITILVCEVKDRIIKLARKQELN